MYTPVQIPHLWMWVQRHPGIINLLSTGAILIGVSLCTNQTPPIFDAQHYVGMATHGFSDQARLAAPYAYRPAAPLLVHLLYTVFGVPVIDGFKVIAWVSSVLLLVLAFRIALDVGATLPAAIATQLGAGFSLFHVKFPLFFPALVDWPAITLMIAAMWYLIRNRYGTAYALSSGGLLFKEFLLIPLALLAFQKLRTFLKDRQTSDLAWVYAVLGSTAIFFVLPRVLIPVQEAYGANFRALNFTGGSLEYFRQLRMFLADPFSPGRIFNLAFVSASYWFPVWILLTNERSRKVVKELGGARLVLLGYLLLVWLFSIVGGTNIMVFINYTAFAMILTLALLLKQGITWHETAAMLGATLLFNRILWDIPLPGEDFEAHINFFAGWSDKVNHATFLRIAEMALFWAFLLTLRRWFTPKVAAPPPQP